MVEPGYRRVPHTADVRIEAWAPTREECVERAVVAMVDGFVELLQERIPVPVDRGRLFERVKSELDLSAEAVVEAEAVLPVAVGLAMPGKRRA